MAGVAACACGALTLPAGVQECSVGPAWPAGPGQPCRAGTLGDEPRRRVAMRADPCVPHQVLPWSYRPWASGCNKTKAIAQERTAGPAGVFLALARMCTRS